MTLLLHSQLPQQRILASSAPHGKAKVPNRDFKHKRKMKYSTGEDNIKLMKY
jgi:hypothetical protein